MASVDDIIDITKSTLTFLDEEKTRKLCVISNYFYSLHEKLLQIESNQKKYLESLYDECRDQIQHRMDELLQLKAAYFENEKELRANSLSGVLENITTSLKKRIEQKREQMISIPKLIILRDERIFKDVENVCIVQIAAPYSNKESPLWSWGRNVNLNPPSLSYPQDLCIDEPKGEIYIVDTGNNRVLVCSVKGEYIRSIENPSLDKPTRICNSIYCFYLSQPDTKLIFQFEKLTGQLINTFNLGFRASGIFCFNSSLVYICEYSMPKIIVLHTNLTFDETVILKSNFFETKGQQFDNTHTESVQATSKELWVLFSDSLYPLQCFSLTGDFIRYVITEDKIDRAFHFCLDLIGNILISDWDANRIRIFSLNGDSLCTIGKDGQAGGGDIFQPLGIAVTTEFNILILDWKQNNSLQLY